MLRRRRPLEEVPVGEGEPTPSVEVLRAVRRLELRTRGFVDSLFSGEHASAALGRGVEFSHVRAYQVGDDVRAIDWKVTARRGEPYVRQFVEERDLLVVLVVDVSASGRFGPGERSAAEVAAEVAAALAFSAARRNDRSALLLVSDRIERHVPPGSGRKHALRLLTHLIADQPVGRGTDLIPALERLVRTVHERAIVFVVSDFVQAEVGDALPLRDAIRRVARLHDLVGVRLMSRLADELPRVGWVEMTDPESGKRVLLDTGSARVRDRVREGVLRAHARTNALFAEAGAELVEVDLQQDPLAALADFFRRRRVQR